MFHVGEPYIHVQPGRGLGFNGGDCRFLPVQIEIGNDIPTDFFGSDSIEFEVSRPSEFVLRKVRPHIA